MSKGPKPAKPAIRYAVVNKNGEILGALCRRRKPLDQLVAEYGDPGERVARFKLTEEQE